MKRVAQFLGLLVAAYVMVVFFFNFPFAAPVELTFNPASDGKSYIVTAHNTSGYGFWTVARIRKATSSEGLDEGFSMQPFETKEVKWLGIKVESGDHIGLGDRLHRTLSFTVP